MLSRTARSVAGLATGVTFAVLGLDAARSPGPRVAMASSTLGAIRKVVPVPMDDETVVAANGAVQVAAAVALVGGSFASARLQRAAAVVLLGSLIPTTIAGHDFWNVDDPMNRKMQTIQFLKNTAMLGGLLFAISDRADRAPAA